MTGPKKPQGESGAISLSGQGAEWKVTSFPKTKPEVETMVATIFVEAANRLVMRGSQPSLSPFTSLTKNAENDLDFTVATVQGERLLELAEFAPLKEHGPKFENAPRSIPPAEKASLALAAVEKKSAHQGGKGRLLLLYSTEHAFKLDGITLEMMRREFAKVPPNFDRVYYVSIMDETSGMAWEAYPAAPSGPLSALTDAELYSGDHDVPHPLDWSGVAKVKKD